MKRMGFLSCLPSLIVLASGCGGAAESDLFVPGGDGAGPGAQTGAPGATKTPTNGKATASACSPAIATDCAVGEYCKVSACAAAGGTCTKRPAVATALTPICGCDGVTYWNESVAASFGVNTKQDGACPATIAKKCNDTSLDCPDQRFCNRQVESALACTQPSGVCWGIPQPCPTGGGRQRRCGAGTACATTCESIKSEKAFYSDNLCN